MNENRILNAAASDEVGYRDPQAYPPPGGVKLLLLTEGGVAVIGTWADGPGFVAWSYLPKRTVRSAPQLSVEPEECRSPYCECVAGRCVHGRIDKRGEPVRTREHHIAFREASEIAAERDYFNARPHLTNDGPATMLFEAGFRRGFDAAGEAYACPAFPEVTDEMVEVFLRAAGKHRIEISRPSIEGDDGLRASLRAALRGT